MLKRSERTMERYMKAGANMRLYKTLGCVVWASVGNLIPAADRIRLRRALNIIEEVSSSAEDNMFHDHPNLDREYIDVFFGATTNPPVTGVDKQILDLAKETADELFKGN